MRTVLTLVFTLCFCSLMTAQVYVNANASGTNDGTSWTDAYNKLQTALDSADSGSQLWIAAGTYLPEAVVDLDTMSFSIDKPLELYGGFDGTELTLEERDWETNITRLSADNNGDDVNGDYDNFRSDNARHVIVIFLEEPGEILFDGVSITNAAGYLTDPPQGAPDFTPWLGGGILASASVRLSNCIFAENTSYVGGAVFITGQEAMNTDRVIVNNCEFSGNRSALGTLRFQDLSNISFQNTLIENNSSSGFGGGVVFGNSNASFEDCIFRGNISETSIGGGLFGFQNAANTFTDPTVVIRGCSFEENFAAFGGGFAYNNFFPGSELTIDSSSFIENGTFGGDAGFGGAAIVQNIVDPSSTMTPSLALDINMSTFEDNTAGTTAGLAVYAGQDSDGIIANISNVSFTDNEAINFYGGASFVNDNSFLQLAMNNVVFDGNSSGQIAGALGLTNDNDEARLQYVMDNCLFSDNSSQYGGAIWSTANDDLGSIGTISNCGFVDNIGTNCCGAIGSIVEKVTIDNSLFEGNSTQGLDEDINGGGAIYFLTDEARITNSIFEGNSSDAAGSAIMIRGGDEVYLENLLMEENTGGAAIDNADSLWMTNLTFVGNDMGLSQIAGGVSIVQNTIFDSEEANYSAEVDTTISVISNGANLSTDSTFLTFFTGANGFADFNNMDPLLDANFVPSEDSPCVDTGNPNGVDWVIDLNAQTRSQGVSVDIGAFESPFDTPVRNINTLDITVYPNPFVQEIQLSSIEKMESIRLLDINGRTMQQFPIQQTLQVNTALPTGVYFLEVSIEGQSYFKKLEKM